MSSSKRLIELAEAITACKDEFYARGAILRTAEETVEFLNAEKKFHEAKVALEDLEKDVAARKLRSHNFQVTMEKQS